MQIPKILVIRQRIFMSFYENDKKIYKEFFEKVKAKDFSKIVFVSEYDKNVFVNNFKELKEKCLYCNNLIDYKKIEQKSKDSSGNFEQKDNIVTFINLGRHDEKQKKLSRIIERLQKN